MLILYQNMVARFFFQVLSVSHIIIIITSGPVRDSSIFIRPHKYTIKGKLQEFIKKKKENCRSYRVKSHAILTLHLVEKQFFLSKFEKRF